MCGEPEVARRWLVLVADSSLQRILYTSRRCGTRSCVYCLSLPLAITLAYGQSVSSALS